MIHAEDENIAAIQGIGPVLAKAFADYFLAMLKQGIHLAPSQFEAMFLSTAHSDEVLEDTLTKIRNYFM